MSWRRNLHSLLLIVFIFAVFQVVGPAAPRLQDNRDHVRVFTRSIEFDFSSWTWDAVILKLSQLVLNPTDYMGLDEQHDLVLDYLYLVENIRQEEDVLTLIYSDPSVSDPEVEAEETRQSLQRLYQDRSNFNPLAESILQQMVTNTVTEMGFTFGGQPIPPVLFHSTPLPWALIVSPRDAIIHDVHISLQTDLNVEQHLQLENQIEDSLDVSSLVVPVGGIGTYPTMVAQTTHINWLAEVISHEWIHNYLSLRPLGMLYSQNNELRTMNETTANLAGKEIGAAIIAAYFPEFVPPPPPPAPVGQEEVIEETEPTPPVFDFREEMHITRVTVDSFLEAGFVEIAEEYMEDRRLFFWDNGYRLRKLNQAYFAFYGAYADVPGGAAGEDPVGAAVRQLREDSASLIEFVNTMAWFRSFEDLENNLFATNSQ